MTVMIAHISPASQHFEESRNTLLYADRAKNIKNTVKKNVMDVTYHIAQYQRWVELDYVEVFWLSCTSQNLRAMVLSPVQYHRRAS